MTEPRTWFVLLHRPGSAIADGESVFDHPGISEHYAFLRRRAEDGTLVAGGPLLDVLGDGMTVLAASTLDEARRLAEQDDLSIAAGVLSVRVRPWRVVMAPIAESS